MGRQGPTERASLIKVSSVVKVNLPLIACIDLGPASKADFWVVKDTGVYFLHTVTMSVHHCLCHVTWLELNNIRSEMLEYAQRSWSF